MNNLTEEQLREGLINWIEAMFEIGIFKAEDWEEGRKEIYESMLGYIVDAGYDD